MTPKNYRGISLNSPLSKLFELVVLDVHSDVLTTSDLQFGFKSSSSTTQCTFVNEEVVQYYNNHHTSVYTPVSQPFFMINPLRDPVQTH